MTILFTDVEGSTELRNRRGDRVADQILSVQERIVRRQIGTHGGHEGAFLGDGFMAAFPSARDALRCAVAIQRDVENHNQDDPDRRVLVRMGLHRGEVAERDGTLYGQAVHAAARVSAEAPGGRIFVSSVLRDVAEETDEGVSLLDRGLFWLKGFPERWRLYEVRWRTGEDPAPRHRHASPKPLVERDAERADLRVAIKAALRGQGSLVLLSGEAGVGKTRLTHEADEEAEACGMRVLVGHCSEMQDGAPYLPFVEILEQALVDPRSPKSLRAAVGQSASEIARIVPGLRRVLPDLPAPLELPPEQARRYLWVSVEEFLERAACDQPLLLVLEDLHWADESTLRLLEHLARRLGEMPVLIIGTYRDSEVGPTHRLARTLTTLSRRHLLTRIALERLSENGVREVVRGLAGQLPPPELVQAIYSESEGNPFFVEEVVLHLSESGRLFDEHGRFSPDLRISEVDVPPSVRLVVGERLARLTPATRDALTAAAASGRVFSLEVLRRVAGLSLDELTEALDEAERANLLSLAEQDDSRLSFVHELIRQTLLADSSLVVRQRLHARTAEAIEVVYGDEIDWHAADVASHLSRSGPSADPARLVRYLRLSGLQASRAAAFEDAVTQFERAVSLATAPDLAGRAELLEHLAMAYRNVGRWEDAVRVMNDAFALYEELEDPESIGRLGWQMVYQLGWAARFPEAMAVAQRGLSTLAEVRDPNRARLLAGGGWILSLGGDHDTATQMLEHGRELAEGLGDDRALADVLHMQCIHHMGFAQMEEGVEAGTRAAEILEREGALWDLCGALAFALYEMGTMGRVREAAELRARVEPLADRLGHLGAKFLVLADRAKTEGVMAGDLQAVDSLARQMIAVCEQGGLPWIYVGHAYTGLAAHWRGDWDEAERALRLALELEPAAAFAGQAAALLAQHLAHAGRGPEALELLEQRQAALPVPGRANSIGSWNLLGGLTEVFYVLDRRRDAAANLGLIEEALAGRADRLTFDCRTFASRAAIAAAAGGQWEKADRYYTRARDAARAMGNRLGEAELMRLWAGMLVERGTEGGEPATELLREALAAYREMGMPRYAELVESALGELATSLP